ncbi:MAG: lysine--tRNA ligase [Actinobacteria bacterium]|nr:lysine--tRNA ligase [Actinomycetota bacterium]
MTAEEEASRLDDLIQARRDKVGALAEAGIEAFAYRFDPTHTLREVRRAWADIEPGSETGEVVRIAGRVVAKREMGKLRFLVLREAGQDLQLFVPAKVLDEASTALLEHLDVGDWVGAEGEVMASKRGELSVRPATLTLLAKTLRPLPDKWHGLADVEQRYRQREVDLIVNEDSRAVFAIRSKVVRALRTEMDERGFVEVETPMLHPIPGGAAARPFVTHHNALDVELFLRIAPELYLKRLIVGGMDRVYEINRNFRNEGMSARHNPEFTMLEAYQAYGDYTDMMELTEALVQRAAIEARGQLAVSFQGRDVDLSGPYPRRPLLELVREATGRDDLTYDLDLVDLRALCADHGVPTEYAWGAGKLVVEMFEKLVEPGLWEPTFVTEHPIETSPLARRHRSQPHVTERFELIATGREWANAFTELIDPNDQRERFEAQALAKAAGDEEAMVLDEAYLRAMEVGLPPTGGLGVGVDRLVMLLADVANIRDVILFPTLRPEA